MKRKEIKFDSPAHKRANKLWKEIIEKVGGPYNASILTGISQSRISMVTRGSLELDGSRTQVLPTLEQAIKMALLADDENITAEKLLPEHDFKYIYQYVQERIKNEIR